MTSKFIPHHRFNSIRDASINKPKVEVSVVIPARDEAAVIGTTVSSISRALAVIECYHEIIVVNDHSTDDTIVEAAKAGAIVNSNFFHPGYGYTVMFGLSRAVGESVVVMVADGADKPLDLVSMVLLKRSAMPATAVFGDRWSGNAVVQGYPPLKRIANRIGNRLAAVLVTGHSYGDLTNPFKLYPRRWVDALLPKIVARDFSMGFELACHYVREGGRFSVIPTSWSERETGTSKFKLKHVIGYLRTMVSVMRRGR